MSDKPRYCDECGLGLATDQTTESCPRCAGDAEFDARHLRREMLVTRACELMGWERTSGHIFGTIRAVAKAEAIAISLDKLEEILNRLTCSSSPKAEEVANFPDDKFAKARAMAPTGPTTTCPCCGRSF